MRYYGDMKTYTVTSLEDTQACAKQWLADISSTYTNSDEALVVGLSGHLGAGKTAFSKIVAELLGVTDAVTSPTFVIMKLYDIDPTLNYPWKRLVHIDAYRLERREELEALGFEQLTADASNLILVEWPEHVGLINFVSYAHVSLQLHHGVRVISIE
jgi:tRNA threonylcarbamoyladenosine biosynthesis protein TsaE